MATLPYIYLSIADDEVLKFEEVVHQTCMELSEKLCSIWFINSIYNSQILLFSPVKWSCKEFHIQQMPLFKKDCIMDIKKVSHLDAR